MHCTLTLLIWLSLCSLCQSNQAITWPLLPSLLLTLCYTPIFPTPSTSSVNGRRRLVGSKQYHQIGQFPAFIVIFNE
ncbi:hypothetical protein V8C42DRAFT_326118 [Trichoderma barbatum]